MTMFRTITPIATPTTEITVIIEMNASERLLQRYRKAIFLENADEVIVATITTGYVYVNQSAEWGRADTL